MKVRISLIQIAYEGKLYYKQFTSYPTDFKSIRRMIPGKGQEDVALGFTTSGERLLLLCNVCRSIINLIRREY